MACGGASEKYRVQLRRILFGSNLTFGATTVAPYAGEGANNSLTCRDISWAAHTFAAQAKHISAHD